MECTLMNTNTTLMRDSTHFGRAPGLPGNSGPQSDDPRTKLAADRVLGMFPAIAAYGVITTASTLLFQAVRSRHLTRVPRSKRCGCCKICSRFLSVSLRH